MKTIEKVTSNGDTQIFEIITSRKELTTWLRDNLWESVYSEYATGIQEDDDTSYSFYSKDGNYTGFFPGDKTHRINVANVSKMVSSNSCTTVIYGNVPIIYNEHYGDWEVDFD